MRKREFIGGGRKMVPCCDYQYRWCNCTVAIAAIWSVPSDSEDDHREADVTVGLQSQ